MRIPRFPIWLKKQIRAMDFLDAVADQKERAYRFRQKRGGCFATQ